MLARYRVLGALGTGRFGPLLAEQVGPGALRRRVVLSRPAPPEVIEAIVPGARVVSEETRISTPEGEKAVSAYVAGADADALGTLPEPVAAEVGLQVVLALQDAGVGHGALSGAAVRVCPDGLVRLVGFSGGGEAADVRALVELLEEWTGGRLLLEASDLSTARRALQEMDREDLRAWVVAHPLPDPVVRQDGRSGQEWGTPGAERPSVSPKVRLAGTAAVTLALGLAAGGVLAAPSSPVIDVPGATSLSLSCPGFDLRIDGATAPLPHTTGACEVSARDAQGVHSRATLDVEPGARYSCTFRDGALRCAER